MKNNLIIASFLLIFGQKSGLAQISSPGLGKTNTASWFALGILQKLDTNKSKGFQSMTYVGLGRISNPDNRNPVYKPALFVLNQEFYHQLNERWKYSLALSYRRQNQYQDLAPFDVSTPTIEQEFRLYSRISYQYKTDRIKFVPTFRQDFRKFYDPDFGSVAENFQFRSRVRLQFAVNLDQNKRHRIIVSSEQLFSISKETQPRTWTNFNYKESRFSLYYSISPKELPVVFSIGYMNNLIGTKALRDAHYLAVDIVIQNPFNLRQRRNEKIIENFE